jgi:hypothetical protein
VNAEDAEDAEQVVGSTWRRSLPDTANTRGALARWSRLGNTATSNNNAVDFTKSAAQGQGDADSDAVGALKASRERLKADGTRGLDNAGKTTIVKKIMGEDVNSVSPTLGFIIKTIEYDG